MWFKKAQTLLQRIFFIEMLTLQLLQISNTFQLINSCEKPYIQFLKSYTEYFHIGPFNSLFFRLIYMTNTISAIQGMEEMMKKSEGISSLGSGTNVSPAFVEHKKFTEEHEKLQG